MFSNPSKFLQNRSISTELSNMVTEKFIEETLSKKNIETVEDERYSHVVSHSKSRFAASIIPNEVLALEFHPTGDVVAYSRMDGSLSIWKLNSTQGRFSQSTGYIYIPGAVNSEMVITSLSWNPKELGQLTTASNSNEIFLWGLDDSKRGIVKLKTIILRNHKTKLNRCVYDPSGKWLLCSTKTECIYLFDVENEHSLHHTLDLWELLKYRDSITSITWNNSGSHIFVGLRNGKLIILEMTFKHDEISFEVIIDIEAHRNSITSLKMDPCGRFLIAGSSDGTCSIWNLRSMSCSSVISDLDSAVISLDIDHLGKIIAICTSGDQVYFYNANNYELIKKESLVSFHSDLIFKFHPNKSWYILSGKDDCLRNLTTQAADELTYWKQEYEKNLGIISKKPTGPGSKNGSVSNHGGPSNKKIYKKRERTVPPLRQNDSSRRTRYNK